MEPHSDSIATASCEVCGDSFIPDGRRKARCGKEHVRSCFECGENFIVKANDKPSKKFCSRACSNGSRSVEKHCLICGVIFTRLAQTCSAACANELRGQSLRDNPVERECAHCGESFSSVGGRIHCNAQHYLSCEVCSKDFAVDAGSERRSCSALCAGTLINSKESQAKRRVTSRKKYGTDFPQQSDLVKAKIEASNLERHGYTSPLGSPQLRDASRQKMLETEGVEWYNQTDAAKQKLRETNLERYGVPNVFMVPEVKDKIQESLQRSIAEGGGKKFPRISKINRFYAELLERELGAKVDFEIPFGKSFADLRLTHGSKEFLIDIHPTISHNGHMPFGCVIGGCGSDCDRHRTLAQGYHRDRAKQAMTEDRKLLQWYGWNSPDELIGLLRPKLQPATRLSARKLKLEPILQRDANIFLGSFHLQGGAKSQSHCYGLYFEGELIAVATFGKSRFGSSLEAEFIRYAVRPGYVIYGGAGRMTERFLDDSQVSALISYIDFDHTTARSVFLTESGFEETVLSGPGLIWHRISDGAKVRNGSLLAQGADRLIGTNYGSRESSGLNNVEIMLLEGFLPVHTAGNRVFELHR